MAEIHINLLFLEVLLINKWKCPREATNAYIYNIQRSTVTTLTCKAIIPWYLPSLNPMWQYVSSFEWNKYQYHKSFSPLAGSIIHSEYNCFKLSLNYNNWIHGISFNSKKLSICRIERNMEGLYSAQMQTSHLAGMLLHSLNFSNCGSWDSRLGRTSQNKWIKTEYYFSIIWITHITLYI